MFSMCMLHVPPLHTYVTHRGHLNTSQRTCPKPHTNLYDNQNKHEQSNCIISTNVCDEHRLLFGWVHCETTNPASVHQISEAKILQKPYKKKNGTPHHEKGFTSLSTWITTKTPLSILFKYTNGLQTE